MKRIHFKFHLAVLLIASLVLGSCTSFKEVACPEIEQNKLLVRKPNRPRNDLVHNRNSHKKGNFKNLSANKYRFQTVKLKSLPGKDPVSIPKVEISRIPSVPGWIENEWVVANALTASVKNDLYLPEKSTGQGIPAIPAVQVLDESRSGPVELLSPREQRQFNRKFKKDLRKSMLAAHSALPQSSDKPAKPMAIAALVLGIVSLFLFPLATGTLGIVFGAIALKRIKANPSQEGRGMALAGLVCGIVGIALWLLLIGLGTAIFFSVF